MARKSPRIIIAVIGLVLIGAASATTYALSVVLSDHLTYRRGDIAYELTVTSETVRGFPTFAKDEQLVDYAYSARDGTAPEQIELTYASEIHPDELLEALQFHCRRMRFEVIGANDPQSANTIRCRASDYDITAAVQPGDTGETRVHVSFVSR